jgi:hypothetical protein
MAIVGRPGRQNKQDGRRIAPKRLFLHSQDPTRTLGPPSSSELSLLSNRGRKLLKIGLGSSARALLFAPLEAFHVRIFRELLFGRAEW